MLGWYFKVAIAQGQNEIARIAEATESKLTASKTQNSKSIATVEKV